MANKIRVDKLLTVDDTGMPKAPDIRQILDKDVQLLWLRDKTKDKSQYIKEVGVTIKLLVFLTFSFLQLLSTFYRCFTGILQPLSRRFKEMVK